MANRRRNPEATAFARDQRATAKEFARDVWQMVRNRRCRGEKFRRKYSIGPYTVDFGCVALKSIVEVDGEHHFQEKGRRQDPRRAAITVAIETQTALVCIGGDGPDDRHVIICAADVHGITW